MLSFGWKFNQIRICQLADYIAYRENQASKQLGAIWWENYISKEPVIPMNSKSGFSQDNKSSPGLMIFTGTQFASILLAGVMLLILLNPSSKPMPDATEVLKFGDQTSSCLIFFLVVDIFITIATFLKIRQSGGG